MPSPFPLQQCAVTSETSTRYYRCLELDDKPVPMPEEGPGSSIEPGSA